MMSGRALQAESQMGAASSPRYPGTTMPHRFPPHRAVDLPACQRCAAKGPQGGSA
jgi:hypothetical protein